MEKIIEAISLYKTYNSINEETCVEALKNINLEVKAGEFVAIMGPSGAGKSTLLNVLTTIDKPTSGTVKINGINTNNMTKKDISKFRYENLGFIYQDFNLLDSLTIFENVVLSLSKTKLSKKEIVRKVSEISNKLEINDLLNKYPMECSGGQQQRCAIARAVISSPRLLVADEPTGNLDSKNSHQVMVQLEKLNNEGSTLLMVTHDSLIASYAKRVLYIIDGRIIHEIIKDNINEKAYFDKITSISSKDMLVHINQN